MSTTHTSLYNGQDSFFRLRSLQTLLMDPSCQYTALVIIGGVDGKDNMGSTQLLKYLFCGHSGQQLRGNQVISSKLEALEDTILFITKNAVSIYYPPILSSLLSPLVVHWPNVTEYVCKGQKDNDEDDVEVGEAFKISSFVDMIGAHEKIGFVMTIGKDVMEVETWPLIQAYGEETSSNTPGFFTMNHTVFNCSLKVNEVVQNIDNHMVKHELVTKSAPLLRQHWNNMVTSMDRVDNVYTRSITSELDAADELLSFYDFGTVRHPALGLQLREHRGARLLYGKRSGDLSEKSGRKTAEDSGVEDLPATHFIVTGEDPATGLRAGRTYFLSSGKIADRIVDPDAVVSSHEPVLERYENESDTCDNTQFLMDMYCILVEGMTTILENMSSLFLTTAKDQAYDAILQASKNHKNISKYNLPSKYFQDHCQILIEFMDASGEPTECSLSGYNHIYLQLSLHNLNACSVMIGESLLIKEKQMYLLTDNIPRFQSWIQFGKEEAYIEHVSRILLSEHMLMGPLLLGKEVGERVVEYPCLFDSEIVPIVYGSLRGHDTGFVFSSSSFNPIIVSFRKNVSRVTTITSDVHDLLLIVIEFETGGGANTPVDQSFPITPLSSKIAIPIIGTSNFQRTLFEFIAAWKESSSTYGYTYLSANEVEDEKAALLLKPFAKGCAAIHDKMEKKNTSVPNKVDAMMVKWTCPRQQGITSTWMKSSKAPVPVSVLLGVPGGSVTSVSKVMMDYSADSNTWYPLHVDCRKAPQDSETYTQETIVDGLLDILSDILGAGKHEKRPRIVLSVTGYVDPIAVVSAIQTVIAMDTTRLKIASVTACLTAHNVYLPKNDTSNLLFLPKVFEQCATGWADSIVVTSCASALKSHIAALRIRLGRCNPNAELFFLEKTTFTSLDNLLSLSAFTNGFKNTLRETLYPHWENKKQLYIHSIFPKVNTIRFRLVLPVLKTQFLAYFNALVPGAQFRSKTNSSLSSDKSNGGETLKGLRLAQSLAKVKVQQSMDHAISTTEAGKLVNTKDCGIVFNITASVVFSENPMCYEYDATCTRAILKEVGTGQRQSTCEFSFSGYNLNPKGLRAVILSCCSDVPTAARHRTRSSVTMEERRVLQMKHNCDPLPEGYLFDGQSYVDFIGNRFQFHPNMDTFVNDFCLSLNEASTAASNAASTAMKNAQGSLEQLL